MGKSDYNIEKLKGADNYHTWCFAMKNVLICRGFDKCIETVTTSDQVLCAETDADKRKQCAALLGLNVETSLYLHITDCKTPLEIWNTFKRLYEDSGLSRKTALLRKLIATRYEDCSSMQDYIDCIKDSKNRLKSIQFEITDDWITAIILAGLPSSYQPFIMSVEAADAEIKADTLISKLLDSVTNGATGEALYSNKKKVQQKEIKNQSYQHCRMWYL